VHFVVVFFFFFPPHPFASVLFVQRKRRECEVQTEEINVLANSVLPVLVRTKYKKERV